ncbi:sporulation YhaL family protein [Calidifontibacillus oryziterrae]|uniref:sporulation YhaL family protein n=1 Tax=Calidifontibacillus oryziterrae TaxID=1191699 RepID=UPI0002F8CA63|nr:sporulation YhaL family protein [Calidifontibacillus oryziterrae]
MLSLPWWIYFVLAGIVFSAYMMIKSVRKDQEIDQSFIEKEGEVYIERMKQERERRRQLPRL